jgi:hypothetical protein
MDTSTPKLNTVADILATIISVASDEAIRSQPESIALMKDLSTLFLSKPKEDIASRILTDASAVNQTLVTMFNLYPSGSEEQKAVVAKAVSLVDEFVKAGKLDRADAWLARGYIVYPSGSEEEKAVVAKQEQLRLLRSSKQMGASPKIDIAGLRAIAKQELARLRAETVGH